MNIKLISVKDFIYDFLDKERFFGYCEKCGQFGNCWVCPPFDFDTNEYILAYKNVYLIASQIYISDDEIKLETHLKINQIIKKHLASVRMILDKTLLDIEKEFSDSKVFFAGNCFNCPNGICTRPLGLPCVQPKKIRHSLESFGFDLAKTASDIFGFDLKWATDDKLPEYFTLISGLFTNSEIALHNKLDTLFSKK